MKMGIAIISKPTAAALMIAIRFQLVLCFGGGVMSFTALFGSVVEGVLGEFCSAIMK